MAEDFKISGKGQKEDQYESLIPQIRALTLGESDLIANLGNISAALKEEFNFLWVGFYIVKDEELILGPFQGPVACTRIQKGKGVCGTAYLEGKTQIVPDVNEFPGHIACSPLSRSEIVIPVLDPHGNAQLVLDIDSERLDNFNEVDRKYLEELAALVGSWL